MTAYKLTVLQLDEVKGCTVVCRQCKAKVTVLLAQLESLDRSKECPGCGKDYDQSLIETLKGLKAASTHIGTSAFSVEFHITQEP